MRRGCLPPVSSLRFIRLLQGLASAQLVRIYAAMEYCLFDPGEIIMQQGAQSDFIYFLHAGSVKTSRTRPASLPRNPQRSASDSVEPEEKILRVLGCGAPLGAFNMLDGGGYLTNAFALETTGCFVLPSEDFRRFAREYAPLNEALLSYLNHKVRTAYAHEELLSLHNVSGALAAQLLLLGDDLGVIQDDGALLLPVPLHQGTLAGLTGHARPTINRVLNQFITAKWISSHPRHRLSILDRHSLRHTHQNGTPRGESTSRKRRPRASE